MKINFGGNRNIFAGRKWKRKEWVMRWIGTKKTKPQKIVQKFDLFPITVVIVSAVAAYLAGVNRDRIQPKIAAMKIPVPAQILKPIRKLRSA